MTQHTAKLFDAGSEAVTDTPVRRVLLKSGRRTFFFVPDDIDWVEAAGNYSEVHARGETFLVREVLGSLERRLQRFGFARIDRSILVNTRRVFEIRKTGRRVYVAVLNDGTQLRLAPSAREELERILLGPS
jgi:two-component system LytT family response regulator